MEYSFPSSHFQSICVFSSVVGFLWMAYIWVLLLCPFSQFVSFGWSISPFTFRVIIDIYVPIDIFLTIWDFLDLFSSLAFLGYISPFNVCCKAGLIVLNSVKKWDPCGFGNLGRRFFFLSVLDIYPAIPFWPSEFLLNHQLLSVWGFLCMLLVASLLLRLICILCV